MFNNGLTDESTRVNSLTIECMVMAFTLFRMGAFIKANIMMIKSRVSVLLIGKTASSMLVIGMMVNNMDTGSS